jgi:serine/threonine-protein kinase
MKTCPTCQASYPDTTAFCSRDGTELVTTGAWATGSIVRGRYHILGKIGEGGMGAVYKAKHTGFDELRAIKVLNPGLAYDEKFLERFKREAYITRKLRHPNAVQVDDIDEAEDGSPFIVMEYIDGKSLMQVIEETGPLPPARVCSIARQVAEALDAAHQLGMIHRDIKPDNIVLVPTREGEKAKVLDFGIAKLREVGREQEAKGLDLTGGGFIVGTPAYISPEQATGKRGDELDGRTDLYSLGIVMYQMLTGELPFKSETTMDMLMAHIQQPPSPIRMVRSDLIIPEPLANLVMRMLQKKREMRPPSAAAFIEELKRIEMRVPATVARYSIGATVAIPAPSGAAVPTGARPVPSAPRAPVAPRPITPVAAPPDQSSPFFLKPTTLLVIALVIGAGIWYHRTHRPADEIARHQDAAADFERRQLFPQAEQEYRDALKLDPENGPLQSALGHVLLEERKWDEAITTLHAAISAAPDNAVAHNNLGVALQTVGNVTAANAEFREAISLQPDYLEAHGNLGEALEKQNDLSGSINEYREVLRLKPEDADAHFHIGLAEYKQGNTDGAIEEYHEAIRLRPGFALAHYSLGGVLYNRGDKDGGIEELRTAYSLSPDDPEIRAAYQKLLEK